MSNNYLIVQNLLIVSAVLIFHSVILLISSNELSLAISVKINSPSLFSKTAFSILNIIVIVL